MNLAALRPAAGTRYLPDLIDNNGGGDLMWIYIVCAGILGLMPGVSYLLILMEAWMIFSIAHNHHVDNIGEIVFFCVVSGAISAVLKTVAHLIHLVPVLGQIANSLVAMLFIFGLYNIADSHYTHLAQTGRHADTIMQTPFSP